MAAGQGRQSAGGDGEGLRADQGPSGSGGGDGWDLWQGACLCPTRVLSGVVYPARWTRRRSLTLMAELQCLTNSAVFAAAAAAVYDIASEGVGVPGACQGSGSQGPRHRRPGS